MKPQMGFWTTGAIGFGVIAVVALASAVARPSKSGDADIVVRVFEEGSPVKEFSSKDAAESHVAQRVGFDEIIPQVMPDGFEPTTLALSPAAPEGRPALRRVAVELEGLGGAKLRLLAVGRAFDFPDRVPELRVGRAGTYDVYRSSDDGELEYTLVTEDRGWIVSVPAGSRVSEEDVLRVLASLLDS